LICLSPIFLFAGIEQAFIFGSFTADVISPTLGVESIGFVMATFGATSVIASFLLGRLGDLKQGLIIITFCGFFAFLAVSALLFFLLLPFSLWGVPSSYPYICAILFGIGDSSWNVFIAIIIGRFYDDNQEAAFANSKLQQSLASGVTFVIGPAFSLPIKLLVLFVMLIVSCTSLLCLHCFVSPINIIDPPEDTELETLAVEPNNYGTIKFERRFSTP